MERGSDPVQPLDGGPALRRGHRVLPTLQVSVVCCARVVIAVYIISVHLYSPLTLSISSQAVQAVASERLRPIQTAQQGAAHSRLVLARHAVQELRETVGAVVALRSPYEAQCRGGADAGVVQR